MCELVVLYGKNCTFAAQRRRRWWWCCGSVVTVGRATVVFVFAVRDLGPASLLVGQRRERGEEGRRRLRGVVGRRRQQRRDRVGARPRRRRRVLGRRQQLALARPREPERVQQQEAILHGHPAMLSDHRTHRTAPHTTSHMAGPPPRTFFRLFLRWFLRCVLTHS